MKNTTAETVARVRKVTGAGYVLCAKALKNFDGNEEKTIDHLASLMKVKIRKSDKVTKEGKMFTYVHTGGRIGVLLQLETETDFVARTEEFDTLGKNICLHIAACNPTDVDDLLKQAFVRDSFSTIEEQINSLSVKVGEKIKIGRFSVFTI
jgi:elongation factor Ts